MIQIIQKNSKFPKLGLKILLFMETNGKQKRLTWLSQS